VSIVARMRSFNAQLLGSHLLVALLTSISLLLLIFVVAVIRPERFTLDQLRNETEHTVADWQRSAAAEGAGSRPIPGQKSFVVIVTADGMVRYHRGATPCQVGMALAACAPALLQQPAGERYRQIDGQRTAEVVLPLIDGARAIGQTQPNWLDDSTIQFDLGGAQVRGLGPSLLAISLLTAVVAIPPALLLTWLIAGPLARRLRAITRTSQRFANGDLEARIGDRHADEVGMLAQQFDDMAGTLTQSIVTLRDLAQQNSELARQVETTAIAAERLRLARDLHDDIAQQLFSLSAQAAALPEQLGRDPALGAKQANAVAALADQTLLDLRAILVDLRPSQVLQRGLAEALQELCQRWQAAHSIPVERAIVLGGRYLPSGVADGIYRVAQESLSNVAKHAQAHAVFVSVVEGQRQITLSVTDDGHGFDPAHVAGGGHFGLVSMQERAGALGGTLVIERDTHQGTTVRLTVPLRWNEDGE
jgi:two-component system, NarL family, sensor histidine kinase LiaS